MSIKRNKFIDNIPQDFVIDVEDELDYEQVDIKTIDKNNVVRICNIVIDKRKLRLRSNISKMDRYDIDSENENIKEFEKYIELISAI